MQESSDAVNLFMSEKLKSASFKSKGEGSLTINNKALYYLTLSRHDGKYSDIRDFEGPHLHTFHYSVYNNL